MLQELSPASWSPQHVINRHYKIILTSYRKRIYEICGVKICIDNTGMLDYQYLYIEIKWTFFSTKLNEKEHSLQ